MQSFIRWGDMIQGPQLLWPWIISSLATGTEILQNWIPSSCRNFTIRNFSQKIFREVYKHGSKMNI